MHISAILFTLILVNSEIWNQLLLILKIYLIKQKKKNQKGVKRNNPCLITNFINNGHDEERRGLDDFDNDIVKIYSWNINGIRPSIHNEYLLKFLKSHKPDVICLNEIRIDDATLIKDKLRSYIPKEYAQFYNCCKVKKGYSGTAIFSRVKPIKVIYDTKVSKHPQEGRVLTLEFKKFYWVTSYFPNSKTKLERLDYRVNEWDKDFWKFIKDLELTGKPVILGGDLNVCHTDEDIVNPSQWYETPWVTRKERQSFSRFLNDGYVDWFRYFHPHNYKFTADSNFRYAKKGNFNDIPKKGWRIDYFIVNKQVIKACLDSDILENVRGSDHVPISLEINLK